VQCLPWPFLNVCSYAHISVILICSHLHGAVISVPTYLPGTFYLPLASWVISGRYSLRADVSLIADSSCTPGAPEPYASNTVPKPITPFDVKVD
jgi:hypothetical protein